MKKEAIAKAAVTKKMNHLAGARLCLPGHSSSREQLIRADLTASFKPTSAAEMIWVNDIAYCTVMIEFIAAQIAALQTRQVASAYSAAVAERMPEEREFGGDDVYSAKDKACLTTYAEAGFTGSYNRSLLDDHLFASLLGRVSSSDVEMSRKLQQLMHDERKERDRIINQLERRRRNAMRDAIEQAEESRRAEAFRRLCSDHASNTAGTGHAPKLITCDHADEVVIDGDGELQIEEGAGRQPADRSARL